MQIDLVFQANIENEKIRLKYHANRFSLSSKYRK